ncbi:TPA: hypothetical protein OCO68_003693 [Escherichia coli]|nr:hypothetical protein [Escherichia coli]
MRDDFCAFILTHGRPDKVLTYGAIAGCTFFIAREHTQAEYRWIEMFGHGKRMNMPWWGGFDPRVWDVASLMDFSVPVVACLLVWLLVNRG